MHPIVASSDAACALRRLAEDWLRVAHRRATAHTPAFGRASPSIAAQSPAAKTKAWLTLCSVASTCTHPTASHASPEAASHGGPTTPVAHNVASTSRKLPSDSGSRPFAQAPARTPHASSTPASTSAARATDHA